MPTLFDSHEEFNEWFSKDIENHALAKTTLDERIYYLYIEYSIKYLKIDQLNRLHLILKPFMLRRVKKDVEQEMAEKVFL